MAKQSRRGKVFSALEVANICGVVNQTAINWIKNEYLKAFTTPGGQFRVYADDLKVFLKERNMRVPEELEKVLGDNENNTFLVIDDDRELNTVITARLRQAFPEHRVEQAFDGFEAGSLLGRLKPSVVFLDINLPGVNGITICRNIKNDPVHGKPIVIAISGMDDQDDRDAVLREGAEGFFSKPLNLDELVETVENSILKR